MAGGFELLPVGRQEFGDAIGGPGLDAEQDVGEILEGIDAGHLAGRADGEHPGQILARLIVADEEGVLAAEGDDPQGGLRLVMPRGICSDLRNSLSASQLLSA